ncbi:MAG: DedA family protein [Rhodocyclaceae bacterium]|nr:DedA family protein [Rhodocyclaceae bacterium]
MEFLTSTEAGLWGLFLSSFLSATLLPGGSEAVLFAVVKLHPEQTAAALLLATLGNTLGGMTTYAMARLIPAKVSACGAAKHIAQLRRWGPPALVLAWAPIVGDALCAAAGWLRLPPLASAFWMALGKGARYVLVAAGAGAF